MPPRIAYERLELPWTGRRPDLLRIVFLARHTLDRKDIVSEDQTAQAVVRTHEYEAGGISYHLLEWPLGMKWLDVNRLANKHPIAFARIFAVERHETPI